MAYKVVLYNEYIDDLQYRNHRFEVYKEFIPMGFTFEQDVWRMGVGEFRIVTDDVGLTEEIYPWATYLILFEDEKILYHGFVVGFDAEFVGGNWEIVLFAREPFARFLNVFKHGFGSKVQKSFDTREEALKYLLDYPPFLLGWVYRGDWAGLGFAFTIEEGEVRSVAKILQTFALTAPKTVFEFEPALTDGTINNVSVRNLPDPFARNVDADRFVDVKFERGKPTSTLFDQIRISGMEWKWNLVVFRTQPIGEFATTGGVTTVAPEIEVGTRFVGRPLVAKLVDDTVGVGAEVANTQSKIAALLDAGERGEVEVSARFTGDWDDLELFDAVRFVIGSRREVFCVVSKKTNAAGDVWVELAKSWETYKKLSD